MLMATIKYKLLTTLKMLLLVNQFTVTNSLSKAVSSGHLTEADSLIIQWTKAW